MMSSCLTSTLQYLQHHKYLVCTETMAFLHSNIIHIIHYNLSIVSDHYIFCIVVLTSLCRTYEASKYVTPLALYM